MPKKTKKHKLQAKGRRKPLVLHVPQTQEKMAISTAEIRYNTPPETEILPSEPIKHAALFGDIRQSSAVFKQEFTKSLLITTVLIIIQFGLFISAQNNYFDITSVIRF